MKPSHKTVALWLALIVLFAALFKFIDPAQKQQKPIPFSQFHLLLKDQEVSEVTVKSDGKIQGKFKAAREDGTDSFQTAGPSALNDEITALMLQNGVTLKYEEAEKTPFWQQLIISWFPMLLLLFLFFLFFRQLQIGGGKAMSFGKSRARLLTENAKKVTFKDVAGVEEAKEDLEEIVSFLKDPKKFTRLGGRIPKGVLLMGPPGTGKTLLARAVAGEAGVPFFSISGSDFVEMFVGVGASRVRDLFEQGKKHAPCIIFIDEIDAVGRHRGAGLGGGHDEREQTLNQLLVEMDGFESTEGVILVAATNRPDVLDPALLRPGRFDRRVVVAAPDVKGRTEILKVHTRKTPVSDDVDVQIIARGTPGFSGADLENLVNEAALIAAREDKKQIEMRDFESAKDKVLMGSERRSMVVSEKDRKITAYHEAGHAIVGLKLPNTDPIHKVTIIPRGRALGVTQTLPKEELLNMERERAENMIALLMGGRIAEDIIFSEITTGAGNDIERATDIARKMVCEWGMSDVLGPLSYGQKDDPIFLGREISQTRDFSEETAQIIDREVRTIVERNYKKAKDILNENLDKLHALGEALLVYETLDGKEVDTVMRGEKIQRAPTESKPRGGKNAEEGAESVTEGNQDKKGTSDGGANPVPAPA